MSTTQHVTATAHDAHWIFGSICTCGWVGPKRWTFQAVKADCLKHERESGWSVMTLPPGFKDWHARVAEGETEDETEAEAA